MSESSLWGFKVTTTVTNPYRTSHRRRFFIRLAISSTKYGTRNKAKNGAIKLTSTTITTIGDNEFVPIYGSLKMITLMPTIQKRRVEIIFRAIERPFITVTNNRKSSDTLRDYKSPLALIYIRHGPPLLLQELWNGLCVRCASSVSYTKRGTPGVGGCFRDTQMTSPCTGEPAPAHCGSVSTAMP